MQMCAKICADPTPATRGPKTPRKKTQHYVRNVENSDLDVVPIAVMLAIHIQPLKPMCTKEIKTRNRKVNTPSISTVNRRVGTEEDPRIEELSTNLVKEVD